MDNLIIIVVVFESGKINLIDMKGILWGGLNYAELIVAFKPSLLKLALHLIVKLIDWEYGHWSVKTGWTSSWKLPTMQSYGCANLNTNALFFRKQISNPSHFV